MDTSNDARPPRTLISAADTEALLRRLRLFSTFAGLGEDARRALAAAGELVELQAGDVVCTAGERNDQIHHLIDGTLAIRTRDGSSITLRAGEGPAREALDEAGEKTATIVAAHNARVFRISADELAATLSRAEAEPVPAADYSDTFSGQALAKLVNELRNEHQHLVTGVHPSGAAERAFGERTLDFDLSATDLESTRPLAAAAGPIREPAGGMSSADASAAIVRDFEAEMRQQVATIRAEERARANAKLRTYAAQLKQQAELQLRTKVKTINARHEATRGVREQEVRKRYEQLLLQANRLARQKAALYQARREHHAQISRVAEVQREFIELSSEMRVQMDAFERVLSFDASDIAPPWPDTDVG